MLSLVVQVGAADKDVLNAAVDKLEETDSAWLEAVLSAFGSCGTSSGGGTVGVDLLTLVKGCKGETLGDATPLAFASCLALRVW